MSMVLTFYFNGNTVKIMIKSLNLEFDSVSIEIESLNHAYRFQLEKLFWIEVLIF